MCPKCNYQTPRLWVKPGRTMKAVSAPAAPAAESYNVQETVTDTASYDTPDTLADTLGTDTTYAPLPSSQPYAAPQGAAPQTVAPVNNPYDMPYEQYGN